MMGRWSVAAVLAAGLAPAALAAQAGTPAAGPQRVAMQAPARSGRGPGEEKRPSVLAAHGIEKEQAPHVDGRLDEPVWALAQVATDFVQNRPNPGKPGTRSTEARVLYTSDAVYVGMRMYDDPDSIAAQVGRRDASNLYSDWVHVMIDSYHDRRTSFRFSVNPRGTKKDVLTYDDTNEDASWDAVWDAAARIDSLGWTVEMRIPLSQLRFSTKNRAASRTGDGGASLGATAAGDAVAGEAEDQLVWGINFGRDIARRDERTWWSPVLPTVNGLVSQEGELSGLKGLRAPRMLEVMPYSVAQVTRAPADPGNPFFRANDGRMSGGLDLKYGVTSNLTLSATVNPDFGQVEADPSEVNLTAFESFFSEKRPFFVEGSEFFNFGIGTDDGSGESLFYSRRIGRTPQRSIDAEGGWVDSPSSTSILGAGKLSGKTRGGWSIGFLDAVTGREHAQVAIPGQPITSELVEPPANYAVGSLGREWNKGQTALSFMGTATNRDLGPGDTFSFLRSAAYSGGARVRHKWGGGNYEVSAYVAGSHIRGSAEAIADAQLSPTHLFQRPDASNLEFDSTRTTLSGAVGNLVVSKNGGGHWRWAFGGHYRSPGLDVNDLGFQQQSDQAMTFGNLRYRQDEPSGIFRSWSIGANPSTGWTTAGERVWSQLNFFGNAQLKNLWQVNIWTGHGFGGMDPTALRGGPSIKSDRWQAMNATVVSDSRKPLGFVFATYVQKDFDNGAGTLWGTPQLTYRASGRLNLAIGPDFRYTHDNWQYVAAQDVAGKTHYVFGDLHQKTFIMTTRLNYTFTPALSLQLYAQPFISGGRFDGFLDVRDPRAQDFDKRFTKLTGARLRYDPSGDEYSADPAGDGSFPLTFSNPAFNFKQMRGNAVLRWEWRPGSTLFLVWSQSRTAFLGGADAGDGNAFQLGREFGRLLNRDSAFPTPVTNVLLVKFSYWLNL